MCYELSKAREDSITGSGEEAVLKVTSIFLDPKMQIDGKSTVSMERLVWNGHYGCICWVPIQAFTLQTQKTDLI